MSNSRVDHTGHNHPATPAGRAACRKAMAATFQVPTVAAPAPIKMTGATARKLARHAAKADMVRATVSDFTVDTGRGKIRAGSVILAEVRGGFPAVYTVLEVSEDIKNGYAGWTAEDRWGYVDQVIRVITY